MADLLPLFVNLRGRRVLLVGAGPVGASKLVQLLAAGAHVHVVAPLIHPDIAAAAAQSDATVIVEPRAFAPADVDGAWLVVAAATPEVNRAVADAAEARRVLVNAVDDPANASAFLGGVVRRGGVTLAISTSGDAPGLSALLRQAIDALLPGEIGEWVSEARKRRAEWRKHGVPMEDRRPLLLEALNALYGATQPASVAPKRAIAQERATPSRTALVSLVGAGPGDPSLLTRAAAARLRAADLVLYDALVDEGVLRLARHAQRFFVGKRAGHHALSQADIHAVMIRAAKRGRRVVRLKGGDPFVLGRGGEEALALLDAGIPFEVVPGVTSAIAAPAIAGIPVTHRGKASAFLVVSGHDVAAFIQAVGGMARRGVTLVVLMGMRTRAALAEALVARGWAPGTPAAIVFDAFASAEQVWRGTLGALAQADDPDGSDGPATLVIGDVAGLDLRTAAAGSKKAQASSERVEPSSERTEQCL